MNLEQDNRTRLQLQAEAAIEYLNKNGWCQDRRRDGARRCAAGVMDEVCIEVTQYGSVMPSGFHELHSAFERIAGSVVGFNDTPGRTKEEVINVFKQITL